MNSNSISLNLDEAIDRMGDRETFLEISRYFAARLPEALEELDRALQAGDTEAATRYAHSMKSNCSAMGAEQLRAHCLSLETVCRKEELEQARMLYAELAPKMLILRDILVKL